MTARKPHVGDTVLIARDEVKYPSKGTWPQFRGRTATVTSINRAGLGPTEYGVVFGATRRREDGSLSGGVQTWFVGHELTILTTAPPSERHAQPRSRGAGAVVPGKGV